jgi:hypothetical protein
MPPGRATLPRLRATRDPVIAPPPFEAADGDRAAPHPRCQSFELCSGDSLYIPRGWAHVATAVAPAPGTTKEASVHLRCGGPLHSRAAATILRQS